MQDGSRNWWRAPHLQTIAEALLAVRAVLLSESQLGEADLQDVAMDMQARLMKAIPAVGLIVALTYVARSTIQRGSNHRSRQEQISG